MGLDMYAYTAARQVSKMNFMNRLSGIQWPKSLLTPR